MADTDKRPADETQFPGLKDDTIPAPSPVLREPEERPHIGRVTFAERLARREMEPVMVSRRALAAHSRRDFLLYGAGAALAAAGFWWLLPEETQQRLHATPRPSARKEALLNKALDFDDDVAKLLYSPHRLAPNYDKSRAVAPAPDGQDGGFPVNYEGGMPQAVYGNYVPHWSLTVSGLASGRTATLRMPDIEALIRRYGREEQVTRLVCVEGWSVIGWWSGLRFADFLAAYPPMPGAKWASLRSKYNIGTNDDGSYYPDPYYVSVDLDTARHPQALLATEQSGRPLTIGHGAPLRLRLPMKLGLKNIKAISSIEYTVDEPADYWNSEGRGYSRYDGL
ncbi:MAG: molybdopterin-dependent oxidoreductase [Armatimonadetes bacterium]|nr:molybdopterin-dependent oxidoreductase [Armatimonadota bacterium]